ncbi:RimK family alpha-L-glutamate ligase [Kribbella sp. NPDC056345]|uniref:ATP-grasp domain-containing protein n=1 Tax=Kribbella sp. NPDC056345 TaxID=3345789 RepID=UPI0035DA15B1
MTLNSLKKRIAIATSADWPELLPEEVSLLDAFRAAGLEPEPVVWTDPSIDWSGYDAVLLRSVWDYYKRQVEFTEWLGLLDKSGVLVLNETDLVRWNSDKRYLLELREQGVAIVPSQVAAGACLREVVAGLDGQQIVIKPTVSGAAYNTVRGLAGSAELDQAMTDLPDDVYLVQPFLPEIQTAGEWSLLFFGGEYSHAVVKRPAAGDYRVQHMFGGNVTLEEPTPEILESAKNALSAARSQPAYARVDGVVVNGRFLLMELELIEPYLFIPEHPAAADSLVGAIAARL